MKYIGNKTRLLDFIEESMVDFGVPMEGTLFDIFGGTGSVGRHFKSLGLKIVSNDFMTYSYIHQYVTVKMNAMPTFKGLPYGSIKNIISYLNELEPKKGYVFENFAPSGKYKRQFFSNENAMKIDSIRDQIEQWKKESKISLEEYYILVCSLVDAADFVANISGTYGAYLKIWRSMALKSLQLKVPKIFSNDKENEVYQEDANKLIRNISCDILYVDPPYNSRQYASNFHVLETLSVWDKAPLYGKTGLRDYSQQKSLYSSKREAINAFEDLITAANAKYIVLSYNNEGIIPRDEIIRILSTKGNYKEYTTDYRRFRTESDHENRKYKDCNDKVIEHLYIVETK